MRMSEAVATGGTSEYRNTFVLANITEEEREKHD